MHPLLYKSHTPYYIQGVTEMQVQNWTMPIKTKNKTFYKNDKKRLTAYFLKYSKIHSWVQTIFC